MDESVAQTPQPSPPDRFQYGLKALLALPAVVAVFFAIASVADFGPAVLAMLLLLVCALSFRHGARAGCAVTVLLGLLVFLLMPGVGSGPPKPGSTCRNNLKQIALAIWRYGEAYGHLPPAYVCDENGRPMHSWRVLVLPYLEQQDVHACYNFNEPWDGPNNRKLIGFMPDVFRCPNSPKNSTTTDYVAIVGPHTAWPGSKPRSLKEITDGLSNTLMLVETADAGIPWMAPRDLEIDKLPLKINPSSGPGISGQHPAKSRFPRQEPAVANAAMADGSVWRLPNRLRPEALKAFLTVDGHEKVKLEELDW
jgi:hypothetical protein